MMVILIVYLFYNIDLKGNAYLMLFFSTYNKEYINNSLNLYNEALLKGQNGVNPDCHLSYSNVLKFEQRYNESIKQLENAGKIDHSLNYESLISEIITLNQTINMNIINKCNIKQKKVQTICKSIKPHVIDDFDECKLNNLVYYYIIFSEGCNKGKYINIKLLKLITSKCSPPEYIFIIIKLWNNY